MGLKEMRCKTLIKHCSTPFFVPLDASAFTCYNSVYGK